MTLFKGTIPSGPGDITVYRDESTDLFKSNRLVERVLISTHDWIYFKTGLYGYGSNAPKRTSKMKNLRITQRELNQVKTWYL